MKHLVLFFSTAILLFSLSGCNKSGNEADDSNVIKKTITDKSGTLTYNQHYKMFGVYTIKSPDADDNDEGINIDSQYLFLIKKFEGNLPDNVEKKVKFSGQYYPAKDRSPYMGGLTVFYIDDLKLSYE